MVLLTLLLVVLAACSSAVSTPLTISEVQSEPETKQESATPLADESRPATLPPTKIPSPQVEQAEQAQQPQEPVVIDLDAVPELDTSRHTVPLEEIIFDTFRRTNRAVPLPDADPDLILSLRDAIPPIYNPVFEGAGEANQWLGSNDIILGYADGPEAFAYPVKILNWHEMVSHTVNGRYILASYCPLCRSGVMYDRNVDGETLTFGNTSALHESDMVMFDHETGSYWMQVSGEAIAGTLASQRMQALPSQTTTWGAWKEQHPQTQVLSRDTGHQRDYSRDPFTGLGEQYNATGRFIFPVSPKGRDDRLDPGDVVLGVEGEGTQRAYALAALGDGVINDRIGETPVVIFGSADGPSGAAYMPVVEEQLLTFSFEAGEIHDQQTGSTWNMAGQAIAGELAGSELEPVASRSTFWFSLIAAFPDLELYSK
jgi:hypothetical protein